MEEQKEWKVGDRVCLRSGGWYMTVIGVNTTRGVFPPSCVVDSWPGVLCCWLTRDGHLEHGNFPPEALTDK